MVCSDRAICGADTILSGVTSSVSQICVSIFDLQNFYTFSVSGNFGVGSGPSLSTSYYALPAASVSLVGNLATIPSLAYTAGTGYAASQNSGTPCNGEYDFSTSTIATNAPASLGSSNEAYYWFEQGITLESSVPTTSSTSSTSTTPSTSTTTTTDSTSTSTVTTTRPQHLRPQLLRAILRAVQLAQPVLPSQHQGRRPRLRVLPAPAAAERVDRFSVAGSRNLMSGKKLPWLPIPQKFSKSSGASSHRNSSAARTRIISTSR